ncbi:putative permease [Aquibacillus albus]|uniref:Permease n=2 Tax=Aquibacillus albus TaxID=1168171 RepID=A0ABS2N2E0_9BACI|nr:putative permease [Aquibacillus albus]
MGIMILLGVLTALRVEITSDLKAGLMFIILNIAVPSIILNGVFNTEITSHILNQVILIFMISIMYHLAGLLVAWLLARLFGFQSLFAKKMTILAALGNSGFIGIPLCATIFGPIGGLLAAIFDAALDLIIFSVVIYMLQSNGRFQMKHLKALINPPLLAITFGLIAASTGIEAPNIVKQLTEMLSSIAGPLAMLYIGMLIPPLIKKRGFTIFPQLWFPITLRLLLIPILVIIIITNSPLNELTRNLIIILSSMPTFMLVTVIFSKYTQDEETAIITTIYSTILCLLTIPLISFFSSWWESFV